MKLTNAISLVPKVFSFSHQLSDVPAILILHPHYLGPLAARIFFSLSSELYFLALWSTQKYNCYRLSSLPFLKRAEHMFPESRELSPENLMNSKVLSTQDYCIGVKRNNSFLLGQLLLSALGLPGFLYKHFHSPDWVLFSVVRWCPVKLYF